MTPFRSRSATALFSLFFTWGILALAGEATAQSSRIDGSISVDILRGSLAGDVCLSGMDEEGDTITFVLNRVLSLREVTGAEPAPIAIVLEPGGEAVRYTLRRDSASISGPAGEGRPPLCLGYGGSAPVYDVGRGEYRHDDNSAIIAFNGSTVRARGASRWYPAVVNPRTDLTDEAARFDLTIGCDLCGQIYVNGNPPQEGPAGHFSSALPRELLLLAGDLPLTTSGDALIVGEAVHPDSAAAFLSIVREIQALHARYLGVPAPRAPDILKVAPLRQPRRGELWGFYSDPALSLLGASTSRLTEVLLGDSLPPRRNVYTFLAHELAHQYFGWSIGTATTQRDFFGEPFATFLELKAMRERFGDADYRRALRNLRERVLGGSELIPPDVATQQEIESGRYGSGPLLLFALESVVGESRMQALLRALVAAPAEEKRGANLAYLRQIALGVGIDDSLWQRWETSCLRMTIDENSCLRAIGE